MSDGDSILDAETNRLFQAAMHGRIKSLDQGRKIMCQAIAEGLISAIRDNAVGGECEGELREVITGYKIVFCRLADKQIPIGK